MTDWMELPHTYPDEEKVLRWTPYILELRQAVDALSRPTPAAPDEEVTEAGDESLSSYEPASSDIPDEMIEAGHLAVLDASRRNLYSKAFAAQVYTAMRLARPAMRAARPAPTPEPSAQEPSAELAALRARCERLAAVACRAIALRIPAWLEPQMAGVELEGARVCRLRDALLALHPGDTEEAK